MKMPHWFYQALYKLWYWYARYILRIPFILTWVPDQDNKRIMGITFAWTSTYTDAIMRAFETKDKGELHGDDNTAAD